MLPNYIMLTEARIVGNEIRQAPILVGTRHIISITDEGTFRRIRLYPDRPILVTEEWDELQALLDSPEMHS